MKLKQETETVKTNNKQAQKSKIADRSDKKKQWKVTLNKNSEQNKILRKNAQKQQTKKKLKQQTETINKH